MIIAAMGSRQAMTEEPMKVCGKYYGSIPDRATKCMHCRSPQGFWATIAEGNNKPKESCCGCTCAIPTMAVGIGMLGTLWILIQGLL